jgi:hypothetical protein
MATGPRDPLPNVLNSKRLALDVTQFFQLVEEDADPIAFAL